MRLKLGLQATAVRGAQCQLKRQDGEPCNAALDTDQRHALLCDIGPVKMRTHNALTAILAKAVRRTGGWADLERVVPEWYTLQEDGSVKEAVLDAVIDWPGAGAQVRVDVSVRCAVGRHLQGASTRAGAAARDGEECKRRRYGPGVAALIFEHLGRLGQAGQATLSRLARLSKDYGRAPPAGGPPQGLNLRRLRVQMEAALLRGAAERVLLSLGSTATSALGWALAAGARRVASA